MRILITGATGNVGLATLRSLQQMALPHAWIKACATQPEAAAKRYPDLKAEWVAFDFLNPNPGLISWAQRVLLIRPPQLSQVNRIFKPFVESLTQAEVEQVVFLSLQGADKNTLTPHHKIEKLLLASGLNSFFLRPSFFMQNLTTTHRDEIRNLDEIFVPAGKGRTNFVDTEDIGVVAARILTGPAPETGAMELTGDTAFTYTEIAEILSLELGRPIRYASPGTAQFVIRALKEGRPLGLALVMAALYTVARQGTAAGYSPEMERYLGRPPSSLQAFVHLHRKTWLR